MTFPNGIVKEGQFEFNVYKGPKIDQAALSALGNQQ